MVAKRSPGELEPASDQKTYQVRWEDLPLSCPASWMTVWNAHPRVYLPVHRSGREKCEYCGAEFELLDPEPGQSMPPYDSVEIERYFRTALDRVEAQHQANESAAGEQGA